MNRLKNTGLVLCGLVLGLTLSAPAAQAVESLKATLSTNRILVDGQETHMTAYTIGGSNYALSHHRRALPYRSHPHAGAAGLRGG